MEQRKEAVLIGIIQHHVPCSREDARGVLLKHKNNLNNAINDLKGHFNRKEYYVEEVITVRGDRLVSTVKNLLRKSNLIHLSILKDGKVLISIPVSVSLVLFYLYPFLAALTMGYLIKHEYAIRILKAV